ncbi:M1 family metallopeptidase [Fimbriimonas ginsengisoli]|uniref:Peptidase M1, membrane alanine aminopeptidase n=1 Tax=Fimbriimonas ginsengisoli Gsoil 348 TaxID=661478 RepID=A0A068NVR7_FIMGI|nr:M1 family aminopeptidase [Fimbriimonas ginsengisoli]AIE87531.1 peptidase M1, membrane alanine aminopeptidase [Fimbriimonas ginsengisoli Gsoil 348]
MLPCVIGLLTYAPGPSIQAIDAMAKRRDVAGLTKLLAPLPEGIRNPFRVLKTGGAYEVGRFGWHAEELTAADGGARYVVIGTPLTSEDVGETVLKRVGNKLAYVPESDPMGTTVLGHRFDLKFDIPKKHAALRDDLTLKFAPGAPQAILFRMSSQYKVARIEDERGRPVTFRQASGVVSMRRGKGSYGTYRVIYGATVNLPSYAGSISSTEATLVNDYWYPMIARQPSPYQILIHSPKGWTAVAQGIKTLEHETGAELVTGYKMDLPVVYFSVDAAPFKTFSQTLNGRRYSAWSTRVSEVQLRAQTELYLPIFEFYAKSFCPPPYPMYGAVDSEHYGGGALEAYTYATYGGGLPTEDAHEPAHTWWGGLINNTYLGSFWNESFAVFCDGLYHREVAIGNQAERRLAFVSDGNAEPDYAQAAMNSSGADVGPVGSSLGYGKGAKVLQMMQQWMGTKWLIETMSTWVRTHPRGKPGDWADFERVVLSRSSNKAEMKGFLADWIHRPGFSDFDATAKWTGKGVDLKIHWHGPRFRMPLTVMLQSGARRSFSMVFLDGKNDTVHLPSGWKPELVSVDPWRQAVRVMEPNEAPMDLGLGLQALKKVVDPQHTDWLSSLGGTAEPLTDTTDPAGHFLVGSPESSPVMRTLCDRVGFKVTANRLTYDGTTIDLDHGSALAVVNLPGGKRCVIGLGKTRVAPNWGRARLVLTDDLGRFLRGVTEPKTKGRLTIRL